MTAKRVTKQPADGLTIMSVSLPSAVAPSLLDGENVFWKIDCYDPTFSRHSDDPADPLKTQRVLIILLAEEY
jgi:hypothetical protein